MNKGMIRALVLAGVFLVSTVVFSFLTNKTNPDMTTELEEATLPTVQLYYKEQKINELYGYVDEMNAVYMRDSITPIDTDRLLPIRVQNGSYAVDELSYEIRSMDTKRLIADTKVDELFPEEWSDYSRPSDSESSGFQCGISVDYTFTAWG